MTSQQLKERLLREAGTAQNKLLKDLGFKDLDEAKTRLNSLIELEKAQMTEQERLKAENDELRRKADEYRQVAERETNSRAAEKREALMKKALTEAGLNPKFADMTLPLVEKHVNETYGTDAEFKTSDLKSFVDGIKTESPELFTVVEKPAGDTSPKPTAPGAKPPAKPTGKKVSDMTNEEYAAYKRANNLR